MEVQMNRSITKWVLILLVMTIFNVGMLVAQSKENGAIEGWVLMEDGKPLAGAQVILSSPKMVGGDKTVVSGEEGKFRFPALMPGFYTVEVKFEGFNAQKKSGIKVSVGTTLTVNFAMSLGQITESVAVSGIMPMLDIKDSATSVSNLSSEYVLNIPNTQNVSAMVNLAPGVTQDSIFGATTSGVQYQIDGVDVSDPELGTAYVFIDYGTVEEVMVSGVGASAEYDGFTGGVFNTVTKSGGNVLEGMFDSYIQPTSWNSVNSDLFTPAKRGLLNAHFNLGGALVKDKLFFFLSGQYERRDSVNAGFPENSIYDQPRLMAKLTWQAGRNHRLAGFIHGDLYNGTYRGGNSLTDPEATRDQESPELAFNLNHVWTISGNAFLETKAAGFLSYYKLIPKGGYDLPGHYDQATYRNSVNASGYYHAYRNRLQFNSALSLYSDNFITGSHDIKFGIDTEMNPVKTESGYSGGIQYRDWDGEPYQRRLQEGNVVNATNTRFSAFVQDAWSVTDKLKINPGIRVNFYRGSIDGMGAIFKPEMSIAPRIGVNYDLFDDHSTVIKAHYGKYFENIKSSYYGDFGPTNDLTQEIWDGNGWVNQWTIQFENRYSFADKLRMPYMDQFTIGIEREIMKDLSIGLSYINRSNHDFIDAVATNAIFSAVPYSAEGQNYTLWSHDNIEDTKLIVTNPKQGDYPIVTFTPERKYQGVQLLINKRFSQGWMVNASYTYGKAEGTDENDDWSSYSSGIYYSQYFQDKNYQTNAYGKLTIDPTHMVKITGTFMLPFKVVLSGNFTYITGNNYNKMIWVDENDGLAQGGLYVVADPRGSYRLPAVTNLDLRLEKQVKLGKTLFGLTFDVYNLFNAGTVNSVITDAGADFGTAADVISPRVFRAGFRVYLNN